MKLPLLLFFTCCISAAVMGQTYNIATLNGQTVTTCSGNFTDSNAGGSNYGNNENYTMTFCSANGSPLLFDFSGTGSFDIDVPGDSLFFYDGTSATGTPIAVLTYLDDNTQTTYSSQLQIGTQSTCVTVRFKSNSSGVDVGWSAAISCVTPPVCGTNPPASDIFGQATFICNLNGYCGNTTSYYGEDTPYNLIGGGTCPTPDDGIFGGTIENNSWLSFQANAATASFNFNITNCGAGGTGLQLAVFGFNGSAFTLQSPCATTDGSQMSNTTLTATGLTVGQIYYIMIDGNAGSTCEYTVTANTGVALVNAGPDQTVCSTSATLAAVGLGSWSLVSGSGTITTPTSATSTVTGLGAGANTFRWTPSSLCSGSTDDVVITSSTLSATITGATTVCSGVPITLSANLTSGTATNYNWSTGQTGATQTSISVSTAGTYIVTITASGGCTATAQQIVTLNTAPSASIAPSAAVLSCATFPIALTASGGGTYLWNAAGGNASTASISANAAGTYAVTVTGTNGCTASTSAIVSQGAIAPSITGGSATDCISAPNATYTTNPATFTSYSWAVTNGTIVSGANTATPVVDWTTSGTGILNVTVTNASGCTASATRTITVNSNPTTPIITGGSATDCINSINTAYTTNPSTFTSYSWAVTNGTIVSGANSPTPIVDWTTSGNGVLSVTVTDANGCTTSATRTVTVNTNPVVTSITGGSATDCINAPNATYTTNPATFTSYAWAVTNGTIVSGANTATPVVDWTTSGNGVLNVTVTDANGCTTSSTRTVTVNTNPVVASITGGSAIDCINAPNATYTTNPATFTNYSWTVTNGTIVSGANTATPVVDWTTSGTGILNVTVTNASGCTASATRNVTVNTNPVVTSITGGSAIDCINAPNATYTTNPAIFTSYAWAVTNGTIVSGANTATPVVDWTTSGSGTLNVTVTDANGCTTSATRTVTVNTNPVVTSITGGSAIDCINAPNATYTTNPATFTSYTWAVTNGTIVSGANTATPVVDWTTSGNGILNVTVTDANGCTTSATRTVTVNTNSTAPTITGGSAIDCINAPNATYTTNPATFTSYTWAVTNGTIVSGANTATPVVDWTTSGNGVLSVTVTDANGCTTSATRTVTVNTNPVVTSITGGSATDCINAPNATYTTNPATFTSYAWAVTNGTIVSGANTATPVVDWTTSGSGVLSVTVTDANGCTTSSTRTVTVNTNPVVTSITGGSAIDCINAPNAIYTTNPATFTSYAWAVTNGTIVSGANTATPVVDWTTSGSGVLSVTVTDANGCTTSATRTVTVNTNPVVTSITGGSAIDCINAPNATYTTNPATFTSYAWAVTNGTIVSGANTATPVVDWTTSGNGVLSVTVTDANGCTTSATRTVTVNTNPVVTSITGGSAIDCINAPNATYTTNPATFTSYAWAVTNGTIVSGANTATPVVDWTTSGSGVLSVTVTDANGCTTSSTRTVTVNTNPVVTSITGGSAIDCINAPNATYTTNPATFTSYAWAVTNGTIVSGVNTATPIVDWTTSGSGVLNVTVTDANGCTTSSTRTVTVNTNPVVTSITGGSAIDCINAPNATYTTNPATFTNYSWTVTNGTIVSGANTATPIVDWTTSGNGVLSVTVTDANGCTTSATRTVTVNTNSTAPTITGGSATDCTNAPNVSFTTNPATFTAYTWTITGGTIVSGANTATPVVDWTTSGAGTLNVTVTDANGCSVSSTRSITVNTSPSAAFNINTTTQCLNNNSFTYTDASTAGSGTLSYSWDFGIGATPSSTATTQGPHSVTYSTVGTKIISLTVTNSNGCTASTSSSVIVNANPNASVSPSTATLTCTNLSTILNATGGDSYLWNAIGGNSTSASITANTPGTYIVTVTNTTTGCTASAQTVINQNITPPSASATSSSAILTCSTTSSTITASGGGTYLWNAAGGNATTSSIIVSTPDTYVVTVTDTNNGCTTSAQTVITQNITPPAASINPANAILTCISSSISLTASGGDTYAWSNGLGTNATVSVNTPATYTVTATNTSNGCTATAQSVITQNITVPTVSPSTATLTCASTSVTLTATGGGTYAWSNGLGNTASVVVSSPNTYTVTVTDSASGCTATAQSVVTQNITPPATAITPSNPLLTCADTTITLQAPAGNTSYLWSNSISTANNTINSAGNYSVTITGTNGCNAIGQVTVNAAPALTASISTDSITCVGNSDGGLSVSTLTGTGPYTYLWNNNETTSSTSNLSAGTYSVMINDAAGCMLILSETLSDPTPLNVQISPQDTTIDLGTTVTLTALPNQTVTYQWQADPSVSDLTFQSISATPANESVYSVTVTNANGCTASNVATVHLGGECILKLPNAFSPNTDGSNDTFGPLVNTTYIILDEFNVFDRWGKNVFSTSNLANEWNGQYKGEECPRDVYIYSLKYHCPTDNKVILLSGDVTLLR